MENRILVGIVAFVATLVLVGWIAINEGGRMATFDRQFAARSIERGATLFSSQCSVCHGPDGRGTARAPALNSPLLFGHDFLAETRREREALLTEYGLDTTTDERKAEIDARIIELDVEEEPIIASMQPAIDNGYDPNQYNRLATLGWSSSLYNFVFTTIHSGRPPSESYWPEPMPAWSQNAGGPLRTDQVQDLANFVLNYDRGDEWTIDQLNAVNQFPKIPADPAELAVLQQQIDLLQQSGGVLPDYVGVDTPTADIMAGLEGLTGDPVNGQQLYDGQTVQALPCLGCHLNAAVAPPVAGTWTRVENERLLEPQFEGYTGEAYLAESIIHPNVYVAPNYTGGLMPDTFGSVLTFQDLADLIAYLQTQDG